MPSSLIVAADFRQPPKLSRFPAGSEMLLGMDLRGSTGQGGTGPGPITPDGSPVELYVGAESNGEHRIVLDAIATALPTAFAAPDALLAQDPGSGRDVLELGCGTGRITRPLTAAGHRVVAVDESPDMLAHITGTETVCSPIEQLRLDRRFDVVLMMSFLINAPDAAVRRALLATCVHHVRPDGVVVLQRHDRASFAEPQVLERPGHRLEISDVEHLPGDRDAATMTHTVAGRTWSQRVVAQNFTDEELATLLAESGLGSVSYLTQDHTWLAARPI
ncbi:class I SAM-dependent methyltransferase [Kribbella sp. CA-253562]|uniref:class I SAM-dependent methyltransferase n=1 Tax=Kribbella sp. CA-253562 TaxID=3239942 RepID=UPI003D8E8438